MNNDAVRGPTSRSPPSRVAEKSSLSFDISLSSAKEVQMEFEKTVGRVFSRNASGRRIKIAEREAQMLWLAWRGSDNYLFRHSGNVDGLEFSWQICHHRQIAQIFAESQSSEEFKPITGEFPEPILASIINQVNRFCEQRVKQSSNDLQIATISNEPHVFVEKLSESAFPERRKTEILSSMSLIQDGWTLYIRWSMKEADFLFPRVIEVSQSRLVLLNYPRIIANQGIAKDPSLNATRGYLRFARHKDRLEGQRKRKMGVLRWLSTQRD